MMKLNSSADRNRKKTAVEAAAGRLSSRMRTECEIRQYLQQREYQQDEINAAVAELKDYGYLNDDRYCGEYYRYAKAKGKADRRILQELIQKGVSGETAKNAMAKLRHEEEQIAEDRRKARGQEVPYKEEDFLPRRTDDRTIAGQVAGKMARAQLDSGKPLDEKFLAKVGRRLAGLGYDSSLVYEILGKLRQVEKRRTTAE